MYLFIHYSYANSHAFLNVIIPRNWTQKSHINNSYCTAWKKYRIATPMSQFSPGDNSKKRIFRVCCPYEPHISKGAAIQPSPPLNSARTTWKNINDSLSKLFRNRLTANVDRKVGKRMVQRTRTLIYANLLATLYLNRD